MLASQLPVIALDLDRWFLLFFQSECCAWQLVMTDENVCKSSTTYASVRVNAERAITKRFSSISTHSCCPCAHAQNHTVEMSGFFFSKGGIQVKLRNGMSVTCPISPLRGVATPSRTTQKPFVLKL
jgi:hypothetical protein